MDESALRRLLNDVQTGACLPDEAVRQLRRLPFADLGFAKVDHHRELRQRLPEAVYGQGKTPKECSSIVGELLDGSELLDGGELLDARELFDGGELLEGDDRLDRGELPDRRAGGPVILTRADADQVALAMADHPGGRRTWTGLATGADRARGDLSTVVWRPSPARPATTVVVTAGTADLPVARECIATLSALGLEPDLLADCGVAGIHRLLASADELAGADAVVVVAGMEGALASMVGGITPAPVIAVPVSTGYGAGLEGVTALLAMHASCAAGITVVGIDNGFGAACAVSRLLP